MKVLIVKQLNGSFIPAYDSDKENLSRVKQGEVVECDIKKPRNIRFHRKFFALLNLAYQNQSNYQSIEDMRHDITVCAGYYREVVNAFTGEVKQVAKSISFANMDDVEFSELYEAVKSVICRWVGVTNEQIDDNIAQFF